MKKLFISIILAVLCINLTAQVKFVSSNQDDMRTLTEALVSASKRSFVYDTTVVKNQYRYTIRYKDKENDEYHLEFGFQIVYKGENKDLEIVGVPEYRFSYVSGKYLDLFPFWQAHINPSEDKEALTSKKATYINKDNYTFSFSKSNDYWSIKMKQYN